MFRLPLVHAPPKFPPTKSYRNFSRRIEAVNEESKIPAAALESILRTEELVNRPWRSPDHKMENSALPSAKRPVVGELTG
jgi:hypothetical protein